VSSGASLVALIRQMTRNAFHGFPAAFRFELKPDTLVLTVTAEGGGPAKEPATVVLRRAASVEKR